jgi:hypothetical protein
MSVPQYKGPSAFADSVVDVLVDNSLVTLGREGVIAGPVWVPDHPVYVVTAYNPGTAVALDANEAAQARLRDFLAERKVAWWPAVGRSRDSTWLEPSLALTGVTEAEAIEVGRRFKQDAIFKWDGRHLTVLPSGVGREVTAGP